MKFNDLEFQPIILGADITAYSLARSFHEQYGIRSICLSMRDKGYVPDSSFIDSSEDENEKLISTIKGFIKDSFNQN